MPFNRAMCIYRIKVRLQERTIEGSYISIHQRAFGQLQELNEVINDQLDNPFDMDHEEYSLLDDHIQTFPVESILPNSVLGNTLQPLDETLHRRSLTELRISKKSIPKHTRAFLLMLTDALLEIKGFYR